MFEKLRLAQAARRTQERRAGTKTKDRSREQDEDVYTAGDICTPEPDRDDETTET